jgi:hypothetical protein
VAEFKAEMMEAVVQHEEETMRTSISSRRIAISSKKHMKSSQKPTKTRRKRSAN